MKSLLSNTEVTGKFKFVLLSFIVLLVCNTLTAQLATFPLQSPRAANGNTPEGEARRPVFTDPNVITGINSPLPSMYQISDGPYNATGFRVKTRVGGTGVPWPTSINDNFGFDIPIRPQTGFDMNITRIRFKDTTLTLNNGGIFTIVPYFQVDGTGPFRPVAGAVPQTVSAANTLVNFGPLNETFYSGHTYIVRFYVFNSDGSNNGRNDEMRICNLVFEGTLSSPPAIAPTVTIGTAATSGFYSANVTGSFQFGTGFHTIYEAGFVWSTSANPGLPAADSNQTAVINGTLNSVITGLTAGTTYYVNSYIITQFGIFYGTATSFTTANPSIPTLQTSAVTSIQSNKATSGGFAIDSSGAYISEKGLVWSTSPTPLINSFPGGNKAIFPSGGSLNFADIIKQLLPNTTYYVRAYAINSVGVGYGNIVQFTTAAPAPTLTAIPGTLDFTGSLGGSNPIVLNYSLSGSLLSPAAGNITVTATAPFLISLTGAANSFTSSVLVPYINSQVVSVPIYVQLPTNNLGTFSGFVTHAGGTVTAANADTVRLSGTVEQSPDDVTNRGTDFWLGFGYQENMEEQAGDAQEAKLSLYIAAGDQPATVVVELPGVPGAAGFPRTVSIPANSVVEVTGFPTGDPNDEINPSGLPDVRLFTTGVSNKGIHVYSTNGAEVSLWMYTYANNNSAAGAMVFPTNTWNSSYTVQAFGGKSNVSGPPNSFFFVVAGEDNTEVIFTPSQPVVAANSNTIFGDNHTPADILYPAGVTDTIVLNRGQVFNAMGYISGSGSNSAVGLDLSGTSVRTNCDKKIAVFAGNGRCLVSTPTYCTDPRSGSDNLIQQMIPQVAWGTKYLTVPTKTMEYNLFRIYKQDPAATVNLTINGTASTITAAELYKSLGSNEPMVITSDKPISVTQFIIAGEQGVCAGGGSNNANGNNGYGDPEMIILSAAQQAIKNVSVYSPNFKNAPSTSGSYLNVVIKTGGVSSFKLDLTTNPTQMVDTGQSSYTGNSFGAAPLIPIVNAFKPFPSDPTYSWAKFKVATGTQHRMQSDSGFNAIAYGMGGGESYGFNAGTAVKNLNSIKISVNPNGQDSSTSAVRTCINNPVKLKIALPYNPSLVDSIVWYPENPLDPRVTPNNRNKGAIDGTTNKALFVRSFDIDGRTFYEYESPVSYQFKALGTFRIIANAYGTFASDCPGEDRQKIPIIVGRDNINFTYSALCGNPAVTFTNNTLPMAGSTISSVEWNFGDGNTSNSASNTINHTYTAGNQTLFTVKLTTNNTWGCISSDSLLVDISGGIKPKFTIAPKDTICSGTQLTFDPAQSQITGTTAGNPVKWTWNFGAGEGSDVVINGASSPVQTHTFNTTGLKEVVLSLETTNGCVGIYKDTVVVEATPVAAINPNPTFVCLGQTANYQDASTIAIGNIAGWTWTFDEGSPLVSTVQNPAHVWLTPGNHTVTLAVTSAGGCPSTNTATHTINVNQLPRAGFRYDMNCTSRTLTATDTSNGFGNNITGWEWDFGDGATSTVQNPVHVYAASGTYTVTLFVTTANGCRSATAESVTITIAASPVADFTLPGNTCLPSASPAFTNTTTISDGTIAQVTYTWNFGDGTGDLAAPAVIPVSPTHVFPGTGPYTVTLTAISNNGCTHTISKPYSAIFAQPVAAIAPLTEVCVNGNVAFSSAASTAAGSTVTGWTWNFGDGSPADNTQNPTHTYTSGGTKTVQLTVTSAAGCVSAIDTAFLTVNALPTANFTDTINCSTRSVGFTDISVANSGNITQWNWNFGGTEGTSTQQNPTHVFAAEGNHTITLSVTTDKGCASNPVASQTITINPRPVADFTLPGNVCLPNASALFTNTSTISGNTLMTYQWSFGDGGTSVATSPAHPYTAVGPFTVTLTATSNNGCVHSINKQYNAVFEQPVAAITAPTGVCLGNAASFSSSTSTAPASTVNGWTWNFGDAPLPGSSSDQNPTYTYTGSGPRTVTLTVTSAAGCTSAPTTVNFNVNLSPVAGFTYSAVRCEDSTITFNDASTLNGAAITEWNWNFGDGGTLTQTTLAPATHVFTNSQSYPVSLSVKNANGCVSAAAFSVPVIINPNPVMDFTVSDICVGTGLASFTQNVTLSSGQVAIWNWDFGVAGSAPGSTANPSFTYTTGGEFNVTLTATSDSGCVNAIPKTVKAFSAPTVAFDINNAASLCSNLPVGIIDRSAVTGYGTVDKLEIYWDFQGAPAVKQTINAPAANSTYTNNYPEFGTPATNPYRILIRAFNGPGCSTDLTQDISVLAAPQVQFTQPAPVCQEANSFILTGASDVFGLAGTGDYSGDGVSNGEFTPILAGTGPRTIRYTYTTTNGCVDFEERDIVVNPTPTISFGNQSTINILEGDVLKLNPTIGFGASYLWTPSTYLNSATLASPSGTPLDDIIYNLQVTSDKGCVKTQSVTVKVVRKYIIPNTFTPNNDGNHDFWAIENLEFYPDVRVRVFSRSGQVVFESYGYNKPWDGKFKGQDCPFGTYYYVIETGGGRGPRTGYVTIIR